MSKNGFRWFLPVVAISRLSANKGTSVAKRDWEFQEVITYFHFNPNFQNHTEPSKIAQMDPAIAHLIGQKVP